jgi:hypothetical protein
MMSMQAIARWLRWQKGPWFNRQHRERELEIADRGAQDEAFEAYLDQMSAMLMPNTEQPSLYDALPGDSVSSVARARTLTVLPRLDGERKAWVVQFLYESGLINRGGLVLDLSGADLSGADLSGANLLGVILRGADLRGADLRGADLRWTYLSMADLGAADLSLAKLRGTDLCFADLSGAEVQQWQIDGAASLKGTTMPNGQNYENWLKDREGSAEGERVATLRN